MPTRRGNSNSGKGKQRSAERYYDTSSIEAIKALPVAPLAADDCALFMWAVMPELPGALEVIKAWGFEYKTAGFTWVKQNKSGEGLFTGMGYWTRSNAEICLFATRGSPQLWPKTCLKSSYPRLGSTARNRKKRAAESSGFCLAHISNCSPDRLRMGG
jgi:N6-adenosine-specific RNA methylase IME4